MAFGYCAPSSSGAYTSFSDPTTYDSATGKWTSGAWSAGNPSYEQSFAWFGCADVASCGCATTSEDAALAQGSLACSTPAPTVTPAPTPLWNTTLWAATSWATLASAEMSSTYNSNCAAAKYVHCYYYYEYYLSDE